MERGVLVRERLLKGSEARLVRRGRTGIITVDKSITEEGRKRFAVAHELGHFELHRDSQLLFCTEQDMVVWNENKPQEIEANEFAANVLMPVSLFLARIGKEKPNLEYSQIPSRRVPDELDRDCSSVRAAFSRTLCRSHQQGRRHQVV